MNLVEFLYTKYLELIVISTFGRKKQHDFVIIIRTFIKRHKYRNTHSEALYMSIC